MHGDDTENLPRQLCNYNGWITTNRRLSVAVDEWKIKKELWGTKLRWWRGRILVESMAVVMGFGRDFSSLKRRQSRRFLATVTIGVWPASHELLIDTLLDRWGGQNREIQSSQVRGSSRGFGSVWKVLSLSHTCVHVPLFQASSFTFIYFLTTLPFFFPLCYIGLITTTLSLKIHAVSSILKFSKTLLSKKDTKPWLIQWILLL